MNRNHVLAAVLVLVAFLQGCGGGAAALDGQDSLQGVGNGSGGGSVSAAAPTITYTGFAVVQDGIGYSAKVVVFFSEDMDPASINDQTFLVFDPSGKELAGTIDYLGVTAVFTPTQHFEA